MNTAKNFSTHFHSRHTKNTLPTIPHPQRPKRASLAFPQLPPPGLRIRVDGPKPEQRVIQTLERPQIRLQRPPLGAPGRRRSAPKQLRQAPKQATGGGGGGCVGGAAGGFVRKIERCFELGWARPVECGLLLLLLLLLGWLLGWEGLKRWSRCNQWG